MVILGLLAALVGPKMFKKVGGSKQKAAQAQISMFGHGIGHISPGCGQVSHFGHGPASLARGPGRRQEVGRGPDLPKEVPLDPWGNEYQYVSPGEHGDYDLISLGRRRQFRRRRRGHRHCQLERHRRFFRRRIARKEQVAAAREDSLFSNSSWCWSSSGFSRRWRPRE